MSTKKCKIFMFNRSNCDRKSQLSERDPFHGTVKSVWEITVLPVDVWSSMLY